MFDRNWFMVAEKVDTGESVGVAITVPDINQVLKKMNGRLLPFGWWHFLRRRKIMDRVRVGFLGVKPEYQHTGVAAGLYIEHFDMAAATPQKGGEMGWILETNDAMNRGMEGMGGRVVKRYRVYERVLSLSRPTGRSTLAHSCPTADSAPDRSRRRPARGASLDGEAGGRGAPPAGAGRAPADGSSTCRGPVSLPATVVAATGGFLLGVAAFVLVRILRRPGTGARARAAPRRALAKRRRGVDVAGHARRSSSTSTC